jgi:hypothetical protein
LNSLTLNVFGKPVRIASNDAFLGRVLSDCYSAFVSPVRGADDSPVEVTVIREQDRHALSVIYRESVVECEDLADVLYVVDKTVTIALQHRRPELYFLHAAVISRKDRSLVIVGESGAGKSTFCWDLCNAGFAYMSDELAPVNLDTLEIDAYPRAVCLKRELAEMPALPELTIRTGSTLHVPVESLPGAYESAPKPVGAFVFLTSEQTGVPPRLAAVSASEAAARFYSNGLNQLAHERQGLKAAATLAAKVPCFSLNRGSLRAMRYALADLCELRLAG